MGEAAERPARRAARPSGDRDRTVATPGPVDTRFVLSCGAGGRNVGPLPLLLRSSPAPDRGGRRGAPRADPADPGADWSAVRRGGAGAAAAPLRAARSVRGRASP